MYRLRWVVSLLFVLAFFSCLPDAHAQVDTARLDAETIDSGAFVMTKSPTTAMLLSAALPGAGQVYLHQAWKVPIIWALAGGFFYGAMIQNSRYHDWADSASDRTSRGDIYGAAVAAQAREFYRDDRDKWWIYLGLAYVANVLDAYIAANLYDFDVSTPGTAGMVWQPLLGTDGQRVEMGLRIGF